MYNAGQSGQLSKYNDKYKCKDKDKKGTTREHNDEYKYKDKNKDKRATNLYKGLPRGVSNGSEIGQLFKHCRSLKAGQACHLQRVKCMFLILKCVKCMLQILTKCTNRLSQGKRIFLFVVGKKKS